MALRDDPASTANPTGRHPPTTKPLAPQGLQPKGTQGYTTSARPYPTQRAENGASAAAVFANKLLEEAGSQTGKGLPTAAGKLVGWLRRSGGGDAETGAAVTMVQAKPADPARVELLGQVLGARAERDAEFARQLRQLVDEVGGANIVQVATGGAQVHGGVHGNARVTQVGRDQIQLRDPR